ncbi:MAG: hypothetical protein GY871_07315 [Actinomycetales bacterium]|nr:hypothetical protein [Actinomycetales bacterium]
MRKSWGRLGAVVGVVALLAGGLVGVSAPAQADEPKYSQVVTCAISDPFQSEADANAYKDGLTPEVCPYYLTYTGSSVYKDDDVDRWFVESFGSVDVGGEPGADEPVQEATPPPPCWDASINNCPVGGALRFTAPGYAMVGVPVTMYAYASWRPDANSPAQPTNGTAVIRVDGEDYSGVEFKDGVAEWRFIPETEGMKEFTASGVLFSGLSGANA